MPIRPVPIASLVATLLLGAPAIFAQHIMLVPGPTVIHSVVPDDIDAAKFEAALPRVLRARPELIRFALKKADAERVAAATAAITTAERVVYLRLLEAQPSAPILGTPRALAEMFDGGFCRQSRGRIAALIKVRPDVRVVMMTPNLSPDNVLLGAWAAEGFQNDQLKFDLSELCRSDLFDAAKGSSTPEIATFRCANFLPPTLLGVWAAEGKTLTTVLPS